MKVLQLCKKFPYPMKDGESIAITFLAKALRELGHEVTLLAMNTHKHWIDTEHLPADFDHYLHIATVEVDNRIKPFDAFCNLFSKESYHISRFVQKAYELELTRQLQANQYDLILLETVYLAPYVPTLRQHSDAIVAMRAHNVEHEIWERLGEKASFFKRTYLQRLTPKLRNFEVQALNTYDLMAGITARDIKQFKKLGLNIPALTLPVGLDTRQYMADENSFQQPLSVGFIGSLDWMPNIEGLKWFLEEVWQPFVLPKYPNLQLHIAGRNTPKWLTQCKIKGVVVHGEVNDAADFIKQHSIMIVPLLSGGGMRVKILEAMALGRVNITTQVGMEGIDAAHKQELLVADTPAQFLDAITYCHENPASMLDIGHRAQVFCVEHYDNLKVAKALVQKCNMLRPSLQKQVIV